MIGQTIEEVGPRHPGVEPREVYLLDVTKGARLLQLVSLPEDASNPDLLPHLEEWKKWAHQGMEMSREREARPETILKR